MIKINDIEYAEADTIESFVHLFQTEDGEMRLTFSLGTDKGVPNAGTKQVPTECLNKGWFTEKTNEDGLTYLASKYPLRVKYSGLKFGDKVNPKTGKKPLFANVLSVSQRPIVSKETAKAFFASFRSAPNAAAVTKNAAAVTENAAAVTENAAAVTENAAAVTENAAAVTENELLPPF